MTFGEWYGAQKIQFRATIWFLIISYLFGGVILPIAMNKAKGAIFNSLKWFENPDHVMFFVTALHVIIIAFILFSVRINFKGIPDGSDESLMKYLRSIFGKKSEYFDIGPKRIRSGIHQSLKQFSVAWTLLWGCWLLLYFFFMVESWPNKPDTVSKDHETIEQDRKSNQAHDDNAIEYNGLSEGVEGGQKSPENQRPKTSSKDGKVLNFLRDLFSIITSFLFLTLYFVMSRKTVLYGENDESVSNDISVIIRSSIAAAILGVFSFFVHFGSFDDTLYLFVLRFVIGLVGGVTFMAFLGKVNSVFMGVKPLIMFILFIYAAFQLLYPFDGEVLNKTVIEDKSLMIVLLAVALGSKIMLFLVVSWLMQSRKLAYYMICDAHNRRESQRQFENFKNFDNIS